MKKLLSGMLALAIILAISPAYAKASENENSGEVISFQEYYDAMKTLFAEYGIRYEILSSDENFVYTRELLDTQLAETRAALEKTASNTSVSFAINEVESTEQNLGETSVQALMPYDYTETYDEYIMSPSAVGGANFTMTLNATADAQYGTFLSVKSYSFKQNGRYLNFKSWTETSKGYTFSSDRTACTVTFSGELVVEYTEPTTGITGGYTSSHTVTHTFKV